MTWLAATALRPHAARMSLAAALALVGCGLALQSCSPPAVLEHCSGDPCPPVSGSLEPGESARFRFHLEASRLANLEVYPVGGEPASGLEVRLEAPAGGATDVLSGVRSRLGGTVTWVTERAGEHRLLVTNPDPVSTVDYQITEFRVREAVAGEEHLAAGLRHNAAANRAFNRQDDRAALASLQEAIGEFERAERPDKVVETLNDMAFVQAERAPDEALAYVARGLELARDNGLSTWVIVLLNRRGLLLGDRDAAQALAAFEEGLELALTTESTRWQLVIWGNLGRLHKDLGQLDRAEAMFEAANRKAADAGVLVAQVETLIELARIANSRGDVESVSRMLQTALLRAEESGNQGALARSLHELGNFEERRGLLAAASDHFERCAAINANLGDRRNEAAARLSLGSVLGRLRQPEKAGEAFRRALDLAELRGSVENQARAHLELGRLWQQQGDSTRSEASYQRGLELVDDLAPADRRRLRGLLLYWSGRLEIDRQRLPTAKQRLTAALALQREAQDRPAELLTLAALGTALALEGDAEAGIRTLRQALAMARELGNQGEVLATLYRLARAEAATDPSAALRTISEAIELGERIRWSLGAERFRTDFSATTRSLYGLYVDLLVEAGQTAAAFEAAEEGRARSLLDLLAQAGIAPELQRELASLEGELNRLQARLANAADPELVSALEDTILRTEAEWQRVEAQRRDPAFLAAGRSAVPDFDLGATRRLLGSRRLALEYWLGERRSLVFAVAGGGMDVVELPPRAEIELRVEQLHRALDELRPEEFADAAHWLYSALVEPALGAAAAGQEFEELVVVPDGVLHRLPFEALVSERAGEHRAFADFAYLVRGHAVSYVPSLTTLAVLAERGDAAAPAAGERIVFAAPDYQGPVAFLCPRGAPAGDGEESGEAVAAVSLEPLPGALEEARRVVDRSAGGARAFVGSEATEARVRSPEISQAGSLHFAVHGLVCEPYPERSGLALASGGESGGDGFLQMREIYGLDLSAELVVLSACDSGAGRTVSGEGVVSLARGFFYAGVPSVLVSLWQVPDDSAVELMDSFYAALAEGEAKNEALRRAQLAMIERGGRDASPQRWAPFVLLGDARPARAAGSPGNV